MSETDLPPSGPPPDEAARIRGARQFIRALPHSRALSMDVVRVAPGEAEISMPYDARLVGDPRTGVIHGGAVSALMDTTGGAAVLSHPTAPMATATIGLRIDYMRAATPHQTITARAVCHHVTRSVAFVRAEAFDEDRDKGPVAVANGSFTLDRGAQSRGAQGRDTEDRGSTDGGSTDGVARRGGAREVGTPDGGGRSGRGMRA